MKPLSESRTNMADKSTSEDVHEKKEASGSTQNVGASQNVDADDPELDNLLDSALSDFDAPPKPAPPPAQNTQTSAEAEDPDIPPPPPSGQDEMFSEVFDAAFGGEEGASQLEDMLKAFLDPDTLKNIEKIAEAAGTTDESDESKKQFEDTIRQTLGGLAQNADELQNDVPDDEILRMMGNMNMGGPGAAGEAGDLEFMPMMQHMMKSLISKDVLYPSLKEISGKYPDWLDENKGKVSDDEFNRYTQQHQQMAAICTEFEAEKETDSEEVKKDRFTRILDLMQNMEKLGLPPKELTGDTPMGIPGFGGGMPGMPGIPGMPPMELDENGMPQMPTNPEQCVIM